MTSKDDKEGLSEWGLPTTPPKMLSPEEIHRYLDSISVHDVRACIARARKLDTRNLTVKQVMIRIRHALNVYSHGAVEFFVHELWRAQKCEGGQLFGNVRRLLNPPVDRVTKYGRLNAPGQSLFYSAPDPQTAGVEVRPKVGDIVAFVRMIPKRSPAFLGLIRLGMDRCSEQVHDNLRHTLAEKNPSLHFWLGSQSAFKKWKMADDFFNEVLTEVVPDGAEHRYKFSVALANAMSTWPNLDGFVYPSIAADRNSYNFCVSPSAIEQRFKVGECCAFQVVGHPMQYAYDVRLIAVCHEVSPDGTINWLRQQSPAGMVDGKVHLTRAEMLREIIEKGGLSRW